MYTYNCISILCMFIFVGVFLFAYTYFYMSKFTDSCIAFFILTSSLCVIDYIYIKVAYAVS